MTNREDPLAEFAAAEARLSAIVAESRANRDQATQFAAEAKTTTATARSPRGEVSVTARVGGTITAVQFGDAAMRLTPAALAALTTKTIAAAQHDAAQAFANQAAYQFGANSPIAAQYRADAERAFPAGPQAQPGVWG